MARHYLFQLLVLMTLAIPLHSLAVSACGNEGDKCDDEKMKCCGDRDLICVGVDAADARCRPCVGINEDCVEKICCDELMCIDNDGPGASPRVCKQHPEE